GHRHVCLAAEGGVSGWPMGAGGGTVHAHGLKAADKPDGFGAPVARWRFEGARRSPEVRQGGL
ncbi:hypothetical protein N8H20_21010, partial [Mycobacterium tuberculosis]|uniref:hypothetical protein n=1 Tax=Mycobacterium tuberculosis TaxID=1773 RepID=UPI0021C72F75